VNPSRALIHSNKKNLFAAVLGNARWVMEDEDMCGDPNPSYQYIVVLAHSLINGLF
jgi:hypothetical protein